MLVLKKAHKNRYDRVSKTTSQKTLDQSNLNYVFTKEVPPKNNKTVMFRKLFIIATLWRITIYISKLKSIDKSCSKECHITLLPSILQTRLTM